MSHSIHLTVVDEYLRATCLCGQFTGEIREIGLADLTEVVDEHIREAEETPAWSQSVESINWAGQTIRAETVQVEGYRTESALTSEDQLIDLRHDDLTDADMTYYSD